MKILVNTKELTKQIKKDFDWVKPQRFRRALASSLNRGLTAGRTQASKSLRSVYNVKASGVKKSTKMTKATASQRHGMLDFSGRSIPLIEFRPRQTKKGISVTIKKGKRSKIRRAFIQSVGAKKGVFARGAYKDSNFKFRIKRVKRLGPDLPINELRAFSLAKAVSRDEILTPVTARMSKVFAGRLINQMQRLTQKR